MLKNMAVSLIDHEIIKTTLPKAKELRRIAEPLVTLSKTDNVANRRLAFNRTRNAAAVGKLFSELGPRFAERPGGYTRILKCGFRSGDSAPMAYIEFVDRAPIEGSDALGEEEDLAQEKSLDEKQDLSQDASIVDDAEAVSNNDK
tara:strand:- start:492 stop:926 length:435 start_codon:yes stop_codon:yes gene_type:complete